MVILSVLHLVVAAKVWVVVRIVRRLIMRCEVSIRYLFVRLLVLATILFWLLLLAIVMAVVVVRLGDRNMSRVVYRLNGSVMINWVDHVGDNVLFLFTYGLLIIGVVAGAIVGVTMSFGNVGGAVRVVTTGDRVALTIVWAVEGSMHMVIDWIFLCLLLGVIGSGGQIMHGDVVCHLTTEGDL